MTRPGFCENLPDQPRIWDASRLRTAMECWRKHWLSTIHGYRANSTSVHLEFGTLYHAAVEAYDRAVLARCADPLDLALAELLQQTWVNGVPWGGSLETCFQCTSPAEVPGKRDPAKPVRNTARCIYARAPSSLSPIFWLEPGGWHCGSCRLPTVESRRYIADHPKKTRTNLVRALVEYADSQIGIAPFAFPDGTPAIELECRVPLPIASPGGDPYELTGLIDSLALWEGELTVRERKTTGMHHNAKYWQQFDMNPQVDTYDLLAWCLYAEDSNQGMPIRVLVESLRVGTHECEVRRMPITIPETRRTEWFLELQNVIFDAEVRAKGGVSYDTAWPRNTTSCHTAFGTCQFFRLCHASADDRSAILTEHYHIEPWNPLREETIEC